MEESEKAVAGYTILNDVTAPVEGKEDTYEAYRRDRTTGEVQKVRQRAIFRSKNHDTFTPMGPCIVTRDEMESVDDLRMVTRYDGEVFQQGSTAEYTFKPAEIISFISRFLTLEPGDIVSAGSIGWVKSRLGEVDPSEWVLPSLKGTLELEIEGIGVLRNPVKPEHGG
jgi:2-keto-4-pentenoate hydratase/2-oxohepta-3-ene-1,7-dioic acid hydratase in catechol pathway